MDKNEHLSDELLVTRIQNGDIPAYEILVRRYQNKLLRFARRIVNNTEDAEEVVQDTFINLYKTVERIDTAKKFTSYLYTVAKNSAISYVRKRHMHVSVQDIPEIPDESLTPEEFTEKAVIKESIKTSLHKLPVKYRTVISLYYFRDLSYEEIAGKLDIPINTVRTHIKRAKEMLVGIIKP